MSIGLGTGISADVAILLPQQFFSFRELYLLPGSQVFVMFPLDYFHVTSDNILGGCKGRLEMYANQKFIDN